MINKNNLFNLFNQPNQPNGEGQVSDQEIEIEVQSSTHYKLSKFKKLIENHEIFFEHFKRGFRDEAGNKMNHAESKKEAEFVVFNRAWHYIKDFKLDNKEDVLDLTLFNPHDLIYALYLSIRFFEDQEQYERCAHLLDIQKFLENWIK